MAALRAMKDKLRNRSFTPTEAAAMLALSDVQVNNLIDELAPLGIVHTKDRKRSIEYRGLFSLKLCRDLIQWEIGPNLRIKCVEAALKSPRKKHVSIAGTNIAAMHVGKYRSEVVDRLRALCDSESVVTTKMDVMHGEPCIKGTRIPAYDVFDVIESDGMAEAKRAFPQLTEKVMRSVHLWAKANPRRGRPREIKWPTAKAIKGRSRTRTVTVD